MSDIVVTSIGSRKFHVRIDEDDGEVRHYHVTVPGELIRELNLPEDGLDRVVQQYVRKLYPAAAGMSSRWSHGCQAPRSWSSHHHQFAEPISRASRASKSLTTV